MSDKYRNVNNNRRDGFGFNLYRNTEKGKIGGVCAGLADHFGINANIMRLIFIAGLIFINSIAFFAYIILWIVLSPRKSGKPEYDYEYDEEERCYRKKQMFRYRKPAQDRMQSAHERLESLLKRVENVERYVTSSRYDLDRKFADLEK